MNRTDAQDEHFSPTIIFTTVIGLVFGYIFGSGTESVAIMLLAIFGNSKPPTLSSITETQLILYYLGAMGGAIIGASAVRRGRMKPSAVLIGLITAIFAAIFPVIDNVAAAWGGEPAMPHGAASGAFYFFGWALYLFVLPLILFPDSGNGHTAGDRVRLVATAAVLSLACLLPGVAMRELPAFFFGHYIWLESLVVESPNFPHPATDPNNLLANPEVVNAVTGALVVIAFAPIWWPAAFSKRPQGSRRNPTSAYWIAGFSLLAMLWTGLFGAWLFAPTTTWAAEALIDGKLHALGLFTAFAPFAMAPIVSVLAAWLLTWGDHQPTALGWPPSRRFRWTLIGTMGLTMGIAPLIGMVPMVRAVNGTISQAVFLAGVHALNGFLVGATLLALPWALRLLFGRR